MEARRIAADAPSGGRPSNRREAVPSAPALGDPLKVQALQRTIGNRATRALLLRDVATAPVAAPTGTGAGQVVTTPRQDYVFIMGRDDGFYPLALRYWRAHAPNARFVVDAAPPRRGARQRQLPANETHEPMHDLASLINWINAHVTAPMGNVYIVSHANEDGTLSFGLDLSDRPAARGQRAVPGRDGRLTLPELREALHPSGGGPSALPRINSGLVDSQTTIAIKGCDIGRTQGMVELFDEAFGGQGTVTAPTHEQVYGFDTVLGDRAVAGARQEVEARHPMPPPAPPEPPAVDRSLRGADRTRAQRERQQLVRERQRAQQERRRALQARERAIAADLARVREVGQTYEALSGPMFQHTGAQRFSEAEMRAQVDAMYPHLSDAQREAMARSLVAPDRRRNAQTQGTYHQRGQQVYTRRPFTTSFPEPTTLAEVNQLHGAGFRRQGFTPRTVRAERVPTTGGFDVRIVVEGRVQRRGEEPFDDTITISSTAPISDDATMIGRGRSLIPNADRYSFRVEETHRNATTTRTVVAERVVAYLHHGSLDVGAHTPFTAPTSDSRFYATSTFAPPPPPAQP